MDACSEVNAGRKEVGEYNDGSIASVDTTLKGTAILEAGRRSLDADGQPMDIVYGEDGEPTGIEPHVF